jgi:hypothetical protein
MSLPARSARAVLACAAIAGLAAASTAPAAAAQRAATATRNITFQRWSGSGLSAGTAGGTVLGNNALAIGTPVGTTSYTDPWGSGTAVTYDYATWTSPSYSPGFGLTNLVASWNADTPGTSWVEVDLQGTTGTGTTTKWYVMGRWAADDSQIHRTSVGGQSDANGTVATDTFVAASGVTLTSWKLRVTLYRQTGTTDSPAVRMVGAMSSALPSQTLSQVPPSPLGGAEGITLDVPQYSQDIHTGQYPQWDGGGEAWCSPTSTSMLVASWGDGPTAAEMSWVDPSYADPQVDYAARNTFDYTYNGTGNWPFNAAYAGRYGLDGFVTRLRSLTEAEKFISAGIPLAVSLSFKKNQIPGLDYATGGHLMDIVGFTSSGDPVLNDPVATTDAGVRKVAGRNQFEAAWLTSSGGTVYVIHPAGVALPAEGSQPNW